MWHADPDKPASICTSSPLQQFTNILMDISINYSYIKQLMLVMHQ